MPTQNVSLTPTLDTFVKTQVALGHFNNASEVHRSALADMARREEERELRKEQLRLEIQLGLADVEAGRSSMITSSKDLGSMLNECLEKTIQRLDRANAESLE
jgi:antitoxin ParD1/3/4